MTIAIESVKSFLDKYEWKYDESREDIVVTDFVGEKSKFTLFIKADDDWIIFTISPYVEQIKPDCYLNAFAYLARLNFHATLVKFSIDDKSNVVLTVELPANGLSYESFVASLEALCFYADDQYQVISDLAINLNADLPSLSNR